MWAPLGSWTASANDFEGDPNDATGGGGSPFGNPIPFLLRDLARVQPLPQTYESPGHFSGPAAELLNVSNTPSATGLGGYRQSPLPASPILGGAGSGGTMSPPPGSSPVQMLFEPTSDPKEDSGFANRVKGEPAAAPAEPELRKPDQLAQATDKKDGADDAKPAAAQAAHVGKTVVVEFKGHRFPGLDDGADGFKQLNSAIKREVVELVPNANERRKVDVTQRMVGFTGRKNDGSLADVARYINGSANGQAGDANFTSLEDEIKKPEKLPAGATVRVVIVGYSHGAENAIAAVRAISTFLTQAGYTPQIHLVLIDAIQPGDADPKKGNQRLGSDPYTTLDDGQGNVRELLASFHNYYQTLGKEEGQDKLGMIGAEIGDPDENRPINDLISDLRKSRKDEATPHMAAENVLAREKADPNNPRAPVPLAVLIAQWEVQGF